MTVQQPKPPANASSPGTSSTSRFFSAESIPRIVPFATYMAFIAIADLLMRAGLSAEQLLWLYPVKAIAVGALLFAYRRHYHELIGTRLPLSQLAAASLAGVAVFALWISLDADWMQVGTPDGFDPTSAGGQFVWLLVAFRIAGAALVVPLMEELFWRSFLQRWVAAPAFLTVHPAAVGVKALLVASILFGIEHNLWFAGVIAGIVYGLLYMWTSNLWSAVIAHAVTNALLGFWVLSTESWAYW